MSDTSVSRMSGNPREPMSRPSERADGPPWRAADFQAALRRASREPEPDDEKDDDPVATPNAMPTAQPIGLRSEPLTFAADTEEAGKVDVVPGGAARNPAPAGVEPAAVQPGSPVDLQNFAQMLDKAWVGSFTDGSKAVQIRFMDQALPMTGLQMVRLPDGALSLTLAASGNAVPQVNKSLEALRRRLEARGFDVLDVKVEADAQPPRDQRALPQAGRTGR